MIELGGVEKVYPRGSELVHALRGIDLVLSKGEFVSIIGHSGSGKTTLLQIIGCLDKPTRGSLKIDGIEAGTMREARLVELRREKIGFVFQQFHLLPGLSVYENVTLPLLFSRKKKTEKEIMTILESVGLRERVRHNPNQLSGGEMQRVAIARALVGDPEIILADEPTGNLDSENSNTIIALLESLHARGLSIVMVTHNRDLAGKAQRTIELKDGRIQ